MLMLRVRSHRYILQYSSSYRVTACYAYRVASTGKLAGGDDGRLSASANAKADDAETGS